MKLGSFFIFNKKKELTKACLPILVRVEEGGVMKYFRVRRPR